MSMKSYEFWLVVGSQFLYGPGVLETVASRAARMADEMNASGRLPCRLVYKLTAKTNAEITDIVREANHDEACAGLVTWCHTFSPSKMWINGLAALQKPYCHLATQYDREIPDEEIDMDFMNLNQAAHGDREHGFIAARLRMPRKVIAGFWRDEDVQERLGSWMRAAVGAAFSRRLKVMRFGDNMREVAVTEGDKVEVQAKLGWQVNTWPVGQLVETMDAVTDGEIDALMDTYRELYDFATDDIETVRYQAREELAMKKMLDAEGCRAFSNTFQDLYGMKQLPGLASQHLMAQGYGYGGEGDWKVAAMTAILKAMSEGQTGGTAFMEDYTYHLEKGREYSLGRGTPAGHRRQGTARPPRIRGARRRRHRGELGGHGRPPAPDLPGHPLCGAHHEDAQPAGRAGDVAGGAQPHRGRGVLDHGGRRASHRAELRRDGRADARLGAYHGHRVRAHHKGHHSGGAGARAVPGRPGVEAEVRWAPCWKS